MPKLRTKAQNSIIFATAAKVGVTHDDLHEWTFEMTGGRTEHTSELYFAEAVKIIDRLQSYLKRSETPLRTVQYRRQQAGVVNIDTAKQDKLLQHLWFVIPGRTASGLESLTLRIIKLERPRTTVEFNKVIEAVKSMNDREISGQKSNKEAA